MLSMHPRGELVGIKTKRVINAQQSCIDGCRRQFQHEPVKLDANREKCREAKGSQKVVSTALAVSAPAGRNQQSQDRESNWIGNGK